MDRDKSAFKSHRILALRKRLPLSAFRVNFSYLFVTVFLEGLDVNKKGRNPRNRPKFCDFYPSSKTIL